MDLPEYVSIPLVLVIFTGMMLLFGALLYCCRWMGVPRDQPVRDSGEEQVDGAKPGPSHAKENLLNINNKYELGKVWDGRFVYHHKQAWLRWYRKGYLPVRPTAT